MRKQILCAVWSAALVLVCGSAARGAEPQMDSYIYPPIFQSSSILPNIMIILDPSGSMTFPAYPDPYVPDPDGPSGIAIGANYEGLNGKAVARIGASTDANGQGNDDAVEPSPSGTMRLTDSYLYMSRPSSGTTDYLVGLRFPNVEVPKTVNGVPVTITKAYITFWAYSTSGATTDSFTFYGENAANPVTFSSTTKISSRTWLSQTVLWPANTSTSPDKLTATWTVKTQYKSPDLKNIVSAMVANAGWASGNAMVFKIVGSAGSKRYPYSYNGKLDLCPQLVIEYTPSAPKQYYGYFDPAARYVYNTTGKYFERNTATPTPATSWSGNFLNWVAMRRFDVLKKVLIGGK